MTRLLVAVSAVTMASLLFGVGRSAAGAVYYVDYDGGRDTNAGTSPDAPFKHAPGDPQAAARAKATAPAAGDTVIFKGGVHYRGSLTLTGSGTEGRPIVYDGNTAGTFGQGRAVLEGGHRLTGWRRCASADDCGGNPHWRHLWKTEAPAGVTALSANLVQDGTLGVLAQYPNPADPLFTDDTREYLRTPAAERPGERIVDPRLADLGGEALVGAYAYVWYRTNQIGTQAIRAFDPQAGAIDIEPLKGRPYEEVRYALANALAGPVFDRPGEYVVVEPSEPGGRATVYLWPLNDADPSAADVTVTMRSRAIEMRGPGHFITIQGFKIRNWRYVLHRPHGQQTARGIVILDNEITQIKAGDYANAIELYDTADLLVEDNYLHECPKMRGIVAHTGTGAVIRNNRLVRMGRTPIVMYYMTGGKLLDNTVIHCRGMHSNGMSVYLHCRDVLIEGNRIYDANVPLTINDSVNITIRNNVFDGSGSHQPISFWQNVDGRVVVENNILIGGPQASGLCLGGLGDTTGETFAIELIVRDNIMDGPPRNIMKGRPWPTDVHTGNLYLAVADGFALGDGERVLDSLDAVLPGAARHDYRPAAGISAGPRTETALRP
ncbi:MAG: right-handed parallel beta-helix repeat-containing protein [Planctomycetes bacterium]|nr:right-handed parallel beta-helix repeat-containing protein [Planctomycetota bacterium]